VLARQPCSSIHATHRIFIQRGAFTRNERLLDWDDLWMVYVAIEGIVEEKT
jgi:hypothetical protein